eukprot:7378238-Prymnesium_polylepis.2
MPDTRPLNRSCAARTRTAALFLGWARPRRRRTPHAPAPTRAAGHTRAADQPATPAPPARSPHPLAHTHWPTTAGPHPLAHARPDRAPAAHQQHAQQVGRQHAQDRHGHKDGERVAIDAEDVDELLLRVIVPQRHPVRQRQDRHVRVHDRPRQRELVEVVFPLRRLRGRHKREERREVARDGHREYERGRDPEGPVQVGVGRHLLEEGPLWPRQQRALDAVEHLQRVDVKERL